MKQVLAISTLTLREAIRNKMLYLLLTFALVLIVCSWIIGQLTVGDPMKIIKDLGLNSIHFFGVLITIFIGIGLIFREMEKRTIYLILSKPVKRHQFLLGKFLGLAVTLAMVITVLATVFYIVLAVKGSYSPKILMALYLVYLEWLLIAGMAIVFSSFSTPMLSSMLTLACFLAGHLTESLMLLRERIPAGAGNYFLTALFYILPNLETFNIRAQAVHALKVEPQFYLYATVYGLLYLGVLLLISIGIFQRKDFV